MNIFECFAYLRSVDSTSFGYLCEVCYYKDEYGNVYFDSNYDLSDSFKEMVDLGHNTYFLAKENFDRYAEYEILVTDLNREKASLEKLSCVRRPYYRMRGRSVTKEQAFEIIRRTDSFFSIYMDEIGYHEDFVHACNFNNWLIMRNHYPDGYGWIHVDGKVGCNAITQKYPTVEEFCKEWFFKLKAFPYLDLVIAVTDWDEEPWSPDEKFEDAVVLGIYVHDKCIEILNKQDTLAKYQEYDEKYGQNPERFEPDYYMKHGITQVNEAYLRRCIEAYGLNSDEELEKVPEHAWKERR